MAYEREMEDASRTCPACIALWPMSCGRFVFVMSTKWSRKPVLGPLDSAQPGSQTGPEQFSCGSAIRSEAALSVRHLVLRSDRQRVAERIPWTRDHGRSCGCHVSLNGSKSEAAAATDPRSTATFAPSPNPSWPWDILFFICHSY